MNPKIKNMIKSFLMWYGAISIAWWIAELLGIL